MTAQPEEQQSKPPAPEWELVITIPHRVPVRIDRTEQGVTRLCVPFHTQVGARVAAQTLTLKVDHVPKPV